jgi:phage tail sheath protein FI
MPFYAAPGIYVEEVPSGARPIGAVGTSVAGFIGTAPDQSARRDEVVAVNNWADFARVYASTEAPSTPLTRAVYGFFDNGGGRCYIANVAEGAAIAGTGRRRSGLQLLETVDEIAIVAAPGYADASSYEALLSHCEKMEDRVAILDPPEGVQDVDQLTKVATATGGRSRSGESRGGEGAAGGEAAASGGGATPPGEAGGVRPRQSNYGAFYFPYIMIRDPLSGENVYTPPSGHIAGVWARNDALRGVHKAPANEAIRGAIDLEYRVTRPEQEILNPKGVNCIRYFTTEGIRIWGARMLAAEASEWRYINVRRLFNMIKESIAEGTTWVVFEPNDSTLWRSIKRDVSAFLTRVWRDGALFGRTPQEAFFVQCDEANNPPDVRDAGQVVVTIGLAPVKPAEFVVFKLSQSAGGTQTEIVGG